MLKYKKIRLLLSVITALFICLSVALPETLGRQFTNDIKLPGRQAQVTVSLPDALIAEHAGGGSGPVVYYVGDSGTTMSDETEIGSDVAVGTGKNDFKIGGTPRRTGKSVESTPDANGAEAENPDGNGVAATEYVGGKYSGNIAADTSENPDGVGELTPDSGAATIPVSDGDEAESMGVGELAPDGGESAELTPDGDALLENSYAAVQAKLPVLDAGHGGRDPGTIVNGICEMDIALSVTLRAAEFLDEAGIEYILTRDGDESVSPERRLELANTENAAFLVSVHCDWFKKNSVSGTSTFYEAGDSSSSELAKLIQSYIVADLGAPDRGVHPHDNISLLKEARIPAVCVELGFLSNSGDLSLLVSDDFVEKAARNLADGIKAAVESIG